MLLPNPYGDLKMNKLSYSELSYSELLALLRYHSEAFRAGSWDAGAIDSVAKIQEIGKHLKAAAKLDGYDV